MDGKNLCITCLDILDKVVVHRRSLYINTWVEFKPHCKTSQFRKPFIPLQLRRCKENQSLSSIYPS